MPTIKKENTWPYKDSRRYPGNAAVKGFRPYLHLIESRRQVRREAEV